MRHAGSPPQLLAYRKGRGNSIFRHLLVHLRGRRNGKGEMRREEKKEAALHPGAGGEGRMAKLCGGGRGTHVGKGSNHKRKGGEEGLRRAELRRQAGSVRPTSVPPFLSPVAKWNPLLAPRFSSSSLLPFFGGPIVVHKSMHLVPPASLTGFAPSSLLPRLPFWARPPSIPPPCTPLLPYAPPVSSAPSGEQRGWSEPRSSPSQAAPGAEWQAGAKRKKGL